MACSTAGPPLAPILGQTCGGGGEPGPGVAARVRARPSPIASLAEPIKTTSLTGKVYDPAGNNPLYHVFVYIANNPSDPDLTAFPAGITCDVCGATAAGSPLLSEGTQARHVHGRGRQLHFEERARRQGPHARDPARPLAPRVQGRRRHPVRRNADRRQDPAHAEQAVTGQHPADGHGHRARSTRSSASCARWESTARSSATPAAVVAFSSTSAATRTTRFPSHPDGLGQKDGRRPRRGKARFLAVNPTTNGEPVVNDYDMTILACQGGAYAQEAADLSATTQLRGGRRSRLHHPLQRYTWPSQERSEHGPSQRSRQLERSREVEVSTRTTRADDSAVGHIDLVSNQLAALGIPGLAGRPSTPPRPARAPRRST